MRKDATVTKDDIATGIKQLDIYTGNISASDGAIKQAGGKHAWTIRL